MFHVNFSPILALKIDVKHLGPDLHTPYKLSSVIKWGWKQQDLKSVR